MIKKSSTKRIYYTIYAIFFLVIFAILKLIYCLSPIHYEDFISTQAKKYNFDKYLVYAIIKTESNWNNNASSKKGAEGLMQILPATAKYILAKKNLDINNYDLHNPKSNIEIGFAYLDYLKAKFHKTEYFLAAYNAGEGNVEKWLHDKNKYKNGKLIIPFEETKNYIKKVLTNKSLYKFLYNNK